MKNSAIKLRTTTRMTVLLAAVLFGIGTARAATYTVNSLADPGDGNCNAAECTLREAITQANANGGGDTINFTVNGTINLSSELPNVSVGVSIAGPGAGLLTIRRDSGGDYTVLTVNAIGTVVLVNISGL